MERQLRKGNSSSPKESLRLAVNLKDILPMHKTMNLKEGLPRERRLPIKTMKFCQKASLKAILPINITIIKWKDHLIDNLNQKGN